MSDAGQATRYARAVSTWSSLDWWKLEARALHGVPDLRRALAFFAPAAAWKGLAKDLPIGWGVLLTLSHIASFTLPAVALTAMLGWLFGRFPLAPLGFAGVLAGIAALLAVRGIIVDLKEPLGLDPKVHRMLGWLHLGPSGAALLITGFATMDGAIYNGVEFLGAIGLIADAAAGLAQILIFRGPADTGTQRWQRNIDRLNLAIDAMPSAERARASSDVQHAFETLDERGIVPGDEIAKAREVPSGFLGLTMAPREDLQQPVSGS